MQLPDTGETMHGDTHSIGGEAIFVADSGSALPAIIFVHGTMMDGTVWHGQVEALAPRFRCVCPDLRGHGRSTASSPDISFEDHCDDLASLVKRLSLADVTLVGWSMGGLICQLFITRHPGVASRLVLVDTIPQRLSDDRFAFGQDADSTPRTRQALETDFENTARGFGKRIAPEDEKVAALISNIAANARQDVTINDYVSTDARSLLDNLAHICVPTTIISGSRDLVCKPAASDYMAKHIPGCTNGVQVIAGAGHAPFLTRPQEFNALLTTAMESDAHPGR